MGEEQREEWESSRDRVIDTKLGTERCSKRERGIVRERGIKRERVGNEREEAKRAKIAKERERDSEIMEG